MGDEATERSAPRRLWQGLRILLLVLLGLEVVYLIAANVFLNTELGPRTVNRKPEKWRLAWDSGWSVIPGHMHLSGMVFDRHGRRQQFHAEARKIRSDIRLWPLTGRRFATRDTAIEGLSMAIRRHPDEAAESAGEGSGPRAGAELAVAEPAAGPPPKKPGWSIEIGGIAVTDLESFAFDDVEVRGGRGELSGDFATRVRGEMTLSEAALTWSGAVLRQGEEVLAEPLNMHFDGGFSSFDPRQERGFAVLDHLNGHLGVEGTVSRLAILRRFLARAKWIETLDGHGRLRAELDLIEGRLQFGSELFADAEALRLDFLGYATEGSGEVHGSVGETDGEAGPARMEVVFDDFALRRKPAVIPNVRGTDFRLVATSPVPDLRSRTTDFDVVVDMPRAEVPDMAVYGAYLPADLGLEITSGRGVASLHLEGSAASETAAGHLELAAEKIGGRFQDLAFEAALQADTRISGGDLDDFRLEIHGTRLALFDGVFRDQRNTSEEGWWMTVDVPSGTAHLGGEAPRLEAEVDVTMRDTRVVIAMFAELKSWLQRFEKILTVKDVAATGRVALEGQRLELRDLEIEGRKLRGRGELELGGDRHRALLYVRFHGIAVGFEREGEEKDWKLGKVKPWFERRVAESWADAGGPETPPQPEASGSENR